MEMNYLSDVFSLITSRLISRNLISKPEFHSVYQLSHIGWWFIYKSALRLLFSPCNICLCGRQRWRPHVPLPDKISPKLVEFRGSCSQRSPQYSLYCCVCIGDIHLTAALFLYLVSRGPGLAYGKNLI